MIFIPCQQRLDGFSLQSLALEPAIAEAAFQAGVQKACTWTSGLYCLAFLLVVVCRSIPLQAAGQLDEASGVFVLIDFALNWVALFAVGITWLGFFLKDRAWLKSLATVDWGRLWIVIAATTLCSTCLCDSALFSQQGLSDLPNSQQMQMRDSRAWSTQVLSLVAVRCLPLRCRQALLVPCLSAVVATIAHVINYGAAGALHLPSAFLETLLLFIFTMSFTRSCEAQARQEWKNQKQDLMVRKASSQRRGPRAGAVLRKAGYSSRIQLDTDLKVLAANAEAETILNRKVEGLPFIGLVLPSEADHISHELNALAQGGFMSKKLMANFPMQSGGVVKMKMLVVFDPTSPPDFVVGLTVAQETPTEARPSLRPQDVTPALPGALPILSDVLPVMQAVLEAAPVQMIIRADSSEEEPEAVLTLGEREVREASSLSLTYSISPSGSCLNSSKLVDAELQTDIVWEAFGFKCKRCAKPPLLPRGPQSGPPARLPRRQKRVDLGINGRWVLFPEYVPQAHPWLHYLHIQGSLVLDGNHKKWRLTCDSQGRPMLAGGLLSVEGPSGVLHRDGRSGVRLTYGHLSEAKIKPDSNRDNLQGPSTPQVETPQVTQGTNNRILNTPSLPEEVNTDRSVILATQISPPMSPLNLSMALDPHSEDSSDEEVDPHVLLGIPSRTNTETPDSVLSVRGEPFSTP